jgi:hypothetical protein
MGSRSKPYMNPYLAGTFLGLVLFGSFAVTGHGLGVSGGLARLAVAAEDVILPDHVDRTAYLANMAGGTRTPLDHWLVWSIGGMILGGLVSGALGRRLGVETHKGPNVSRTVRLVAAILGGILVGYGARMARGCTSGQALSGGAMLAAGSWAFMFSVFAGGYLLAWPVRRLWR